MVTYRFSKLQDSMGSRLFKQLLELLEEDISGLPFPDILYKMEKLNLIDNVLKIVHIHQQNYISYGVQVGLKYIYKLCPHQTLKQRMLMPIVAT